VPAGGPILTRGWRCLLFPPGKFSSFNLFDFEQSQDLQRDAPGYALVKGQPYFVAEVLEVERSLDIPVRR
jgi:hypothetical protein